ncbi:MAG: hypothetical protein DSZ05_06290 [Sulfurospirillum sp.]|nr:MAG: hypothetical protein DSZ05_06290 [Sulfurospirillum sp.]
MDYTKSFLAGVFLLLSGGCSAKQNTHAVLHQPSVECLHEVKEKVRQLSEVEHIEISDTVFQKHSLLLLTNIPRRSWVADNPLAGAVGTQIPLRLFVEDGLCRIGLLDQEGRIVRKRRLQNCRCKAEEAQ